MKRDFILKKTLMPLALISIFLLLFSSSGLSQTIELKLSSFDNKEQKARLEIMTSEPVHYHWFYMDNPQALAVDFFEQNISCSFDKEIILEEGPIKSLKTFYLNEEQKTIDFLLFEFRHTPVITAVQDEDSLVVEADNIFLGEPLNLAQRQGTIEEALLLAKQKGQQVNLAEEVAVDAREDIDEGGVLSPINKKIAFVPNAAVSKDKEEDTALASGQNSVTEEGVSEESPLEDEQQNFIIAVATAANISNKNIARLGENILAKADFAGSKNRIDKFRLLKKVYYTALIDSLNRNSVAWKSLAVFVYMISCLSVLGAMSLSYRNKPKIIKKEIPLVPVKVKSKKRKTTEVKKVSRKIKSIKEYRRFPRLEMAGVSLRQHPGLKIETAKEMLPRQAGHLRNLSLCGACFEVGASEQVPVVLQMNIILPQKQWVEVCAKIMWHKGGDLRKKIYGVDFLTIDEDSRNKLKMYLAKNLKRD